MLQDYYIEICEQMRLIKLQNKFQSIQLDLIEPVLLPLHNICSFSLLKHLY